MKVALFIYSFLILCKWSYCNFFATVPHKCDKSQSLDEWLHETKSISSEGKEKIQSILSSASDARPTIINKDQTPDWNLYIQRIASAIGGFSTKGDSKELRFRDFTVYHFDNPVNSTLWHAMNDIKCVDLEEVSSLHMIPNAYLSPTDVQNYKFEEFKTHIPTCGMTKDEPTDGRSSIWHFHHPDGDLPAYMETAHGIGLFRALGSLKSKRSYWTSSVTIFDSTCGENKVYTGAEPFPPGHAGALMSLMISRTIPKSVLPGIIPNYRVLCININSDSAGVSTNYDFLQAYSFVKDEQSRITLHPYTIIDPAPTVRRALSEMASRDRILIASAGNSGCNLDARKGHPDACPELAYTNNHFPITYAATKEFPNMIVVGSSDPSGKRADFSNYGNKKVSVFAPGVDLPTLKGTRLYLASGTSYSAALTAAAMGLLVNNGLAVQKVGVDLLLDSAYRTPDLYGLSRSNGIVNVFNAIEILQHDHELPTPYDPELLKKKKPEAKYVASSQPDEYASSKITTKSIGLIILCIVIFVVAVIVLAQALPFLLAFARVGVSTGFYSLYPAVAAAPATGAVTPTAYFAYGTVALSTVAVA